MANFQGRRQSDNVEDRRNWGPRDQEAYRLDQMWDEYQNGQRQDRPPAPQWYLDEWLSSGQNLPQSVGTEPTPVRGELSAYQPSWRDQLAALLIGDSRDQTKQNLVATLLGSRGLGSTGPSLADATPAAPVFGANEAQMAAEKGDWLGAGLSAASMIPAGSLGAALGKKGIAAVAPEFAPETWYHGTGRSFDAFNPWKTGSAHGSALEMGTYLTPDPADASYWAFRAAAGPRAQQSVPRNAIETIDAAKVAGANVMPVKVAPGKQKVVEGLKRYNAAKFATEAWKARAQGYDTVLFKGIDEGGGPIDRLLVLRPQTNIKSATAQPLVRDVTQRGRTGRPLASAPIVPGADQKIMDAAVDRYPGITAYHGSPHDFEQFDLSKIGAGEGAQAYGHGLYFAENPEVANAYKPTGWKQDYKLNGRDLVDIYQKAQDAGDYGAAAAYERVLMHEPKSKIRQYFLEDPTNSQSKRALQVIDQLPDSIFAPQTGHQYQVSIKAHPDEFLDWDKPLSEQSKFIQDKFAGVNPKTTGEQLAAYLGAQAPKDKPVKQGVTDLLSSSGIKGIRYLDAGSRGSGAGTSNYVVFDPETIRILKKYGMAGVIGGAAAAGAAQPDQAKAKDMQKKNGGGIAGYSLRRGGSVKVIGPDHTGDMAEQARAQLRTLGYDFTKDGIAAFQSDNGLSQSGVIDPMTSGALKALHTTHDKMARGGIAGAGRPSSAPKHPRIKGGFINSDVPGRTDRLPTAVPKDSYIIPADVVGIYGEGNSNAGAKILHQVLHPHSMRLQLTHRGVRKPPNIFARKADGGSAPDDANIIVAGGEYVVDPETVTSIGGGDPERGHRILDNMVVTVRKNGAKQMLKLPGPTR